MAASTTHMEYRNSWSCYKGWKASDKCYTQQKGIVPLQRALLYTTKGHYSLAKSLNCHVNCSTHTYLWPMSGYPGCRQTGETVVMREVCFGIKDYWLHKSTQRAAAQFILQPQYTDNPQSMCEGITCLHYKSICPWVSLVPIKLTHEERSRTAH